MARKARNTARAAGTIIAAALAGMAGCEQPPLEPRPRDMHVRYGADTLADGAALHLPALVAIDGDDGVHSEDLVIRVYNVGEMPLAVHGVEAVEGDTGEFDIDRSALPEVIPALDWGAFTVRLDPSGVSGSRMAVFSVTSDDPDEPDFRFSVEGTAVLKLNASDGGDSDGFGATMTSCGDTLAVEGADSVYVRYRDAGGADSWGEVASVARPAEALALFDDVLAIGGSGDWIYLYYRDQGGADAWGPGFIEGIFGGTLTHFGESISIDGDTMVVGAPLATVGEGFEGLGQGFARVFYREPGNIWGLVEELTSGESPIQLYFGRSVAVSGDTIVVGRMGGDARVFIFRRDQGGADAWGEVTRITAADVGSVSAETFGYTVAVSGDTIVATGAEAGTFCVFCRNEGGVDNWGLTDVLSVSGQTPLYDPPIAIEGDRILVGVLDGAMLFSRDPVTGQWGTGVPLVLAQSDPVGDFGCSVSLSQGTAFIGAPWWSLPGGPGAVYAWEP